MTTAARAVASGAVSALADRRLRRAIEISAFAYLCLRAFLVVASADPLAGADSYTYWSAPYDDPYSGPELGLRGAYLYTPAFIQAIAPLRVLPWEAFQLVWALLGTAALVYLVGPMGAALAVTFLPFVYRDLLVGNIHLLLAAAIVLGIRHPWVWAFPALTKITPAVGVLWFAGRGEWKNVGAAVAVSVMIGAISFVFVPPIWFAWGDRMTSDTGRAGGMYTGLLLIRVLLAGMTAYVAARIGRPWLLPIASLLALPILWPDSLAILLACFPLVAAGKRFRPSEDVYAP